MKKLSIFLIIGFAFPLLSAKHPTHLSVVNMELNSTSLELKYSIRLFQDDINYLISSLYHEELFHSTDTFDLTENLQKLDQYFMENFKILTNGELVAPIIDKKEFNEYEYWLFFHADLNSAPQTIEIINKILTDFHSDQRNLLIFSYDKKEKGLTFDANITRHTIKLENYR